MLTKVYGFYVKHYPTTRTWTFIVAHTEREWVEHYAETHYEGWEHRIDQEPLYAALGAVSEGIRDAVREA